jgi:hypothetical protein
MQFVFLTAMRLLCVSSTRFEDKQIRSENNFHENGFGRREMPLVVSSRKVSRERNLCLQTQSDSRVYAFGRSDLRETHACDANHRRVMSARIRDRLWFANLGAPQKQSGRRMVPGERIELPTNGLQNRCSTAELTRQIKGLSENVSGIATELPPQRQSR